MTSPSGLETRERALDCLWRATRERGPLQNTKAGVFQALSAFSKVKKKNRSAIFEVSAYFRDTPHTLVLVSSPGGLVLPSPSKPMKLVCKVRKATAHESSFFDRETDAKK